ncbi:MAG TPA: NFACT family protein, partial [Nitrospirota bacterium]|nr:NFACT family protein [Nitrospirota bacterium]
MLKAVTRELAAVLPGLRLVEAGEGGAGELYLQFRGGGVKHTLLVSPRPGLPRLHLTRRKPARQGEPAPFGRSLGNLLLGATLVSVEQPGLERAVHFLFGLDKDNVRVNKRVILEFTGKKPNLLVLDEADKILLAQSYQAIEESIRPVLPGLTYQHPPRPPRLEVHTLTAGDIEEIFNKHPGLPPGKALSGEVGGISPLVAREAVCLAGDGGPDAILHSLRALLEKMERPGEPRVYEGPDAITLAAFRLCSHEGIPYKDFASMSEAAEYYYGRLALRQETAALKSALARELGSKLTAARKKAAAIGADLARADEADKYQLYGQILMASLRDVQKNAESVTLTDYQTGDAVEITLDPKLSPVQNAEAYFRKAKKARAGVEILRGRSAAAQKEAGRLEETLRRAENAEGLEELREIESTPTLALPRRWGGYKTSRTKVEMP